jgi:4-hydroxybenzoate polyprenyltransferase
VPRRRPWHPATQLALLHAAPGFTVIAIGLAFGVVAGRHHLQPVRLGLLAGLLATNQYAAGALNDAVDVERDVDAGRAAEKPIPSGAISRRAVVGLAVASGVASLCFGLALGPATLGLAAIALACAWGYDLWLKGTAFSVLPFAIAVPLVPLFGYGAAGRFPPVLWWAWPIGALAAVAVHLADSLPDVESDRAAGVKGLAPRIGVRAAAALVVGAYLVAGAIALASGLAAGDGRVVVWGAALAAALGLTALLAGAAGGQRRRRIAYRLLLAGLVALAIGWAGAVRP